MRGLDIQILLIFKIRWYVSSTLQTWSMYDHVSLGYPDPLCFLPSWKCFDHTTELTSFTVQQHSSPSCWYIFCRCETCPHDICGSWYSPGTPKGCWTYLLNSLWPLQPQSFARPWYPSWYYYYQWSRGKMNISGPSRGVYFLIPEFLRLMLWIQLVPVLLNFHKPLLQKLVHNPPLFPLPQIFFVRLKASAKSSRFYWGTPPGNYHECPAMEASTFRLHCYFYCYDILFCFHCSVYDQYNPLVSLVVGLRW